MINNEIEFIEERVKTLFKHIRNTNSIDEAKEYFIRLEEIQFLLAREVFTNKLVVNVFLGEFLYDFDRIDDKDVKVYIFEKIKNSLL
ncbi:MAG: hypothetical protein ABI851_10300 [Saprospiraceae bacterium]